MPDTTVSLTALAASLTGITVIAALLTMLVSKRLPLYVFVLARRGHFRILEAIASMGGATNVNELYAHFSTGNRIVPARSSLYAMLNRLASAKLLHAVPSDGLGQRYLLTYQGRCRLEGRRG